MKRTITIYSNEFWWGGAVQDGDRFPLSAASTYFGDFTVNRTSNQVSGAFVSSLGRYLFTDGDYSVRVENGTLTVDSTEEVDYGEGFSNLRGAVKAVAKKHYTLEPLADLRAASKPQYCTWMEMRNRPTQDAVLAYANGILDAGLPAGVLILDDGWQRGFGDWRFTDDFPNPKEMIENLHALGFVVILWLVPFVADEAIGLWKEDALLCDGDGKVADRKWWNGVSKLLDMTSRSAVQGLMNQLDALLALGADGFKFDGGDAGFYRVDDRTENPITPNGQARRWAAFAQRYPYAELRSTVGHEGRGLIERLCDKNVAWRGGLDMLIPDMIQAGLVGYPYVCPDMIGGGQITDGDKATDEDWYIRSVQCVCLSPMWQFSRAVWTYGDRVKYAVLECVRLREKLMPYIESAFYNAAATGEPILRPVCYAFSGQDLETQTDCFLLGDDVLVAPIVTPAVASREVRLPAGATWTEIRTGKLYDGGQTVTASGLPCFLRTKVK